MHEACRTAGVPCGIFTMSAEAAAKRRDEGYAFVTVADDIGLDRLGVGAHRRDGVIHFAFPIAVLVIYSFNASRLVTVWGGWSLHWYQELMSDQAMLSAVWMSLPSG